MFSRTCEYAIRALIYIAQKSKNGARVSIKDISLGIDSPEYFIAKILQDLSKKGFVKSMRGPNGGFYMEPKNYNTSIANIVREVDGQSLFTECGLGLKECSNSHPCPIHDEYKVIRSQIIELYEKSTLGIFVENLDLKLTFLKP